MYLAGHKLHNQTSLGWNWASTVGSLYGIKSLMIQYLLGEEEAEEEEEDEKRKGDGVEEQMERRRKSCPWRRLIILTLRRGQQEDEVEVISGYMVNSRLPQAP